jgi:hypothetical protein
VRQKRRKPRSNSLVVQVHAVHAVPSLPQLGIPNRIWTFDASPLDASLLSSVNLNAEPWQPLPPATES